MMATSTLPADYSLTDLQDLSSNSGYYSTAVSYTNIREQALQEAALALGTQGGLAYEAGQINTVVNQNAAMLDRIFDFNQVMYEDNVMPPILNTANNLVNINPAGDTIRIAGVTYTILAPARFVTVPPTWRDYIWLNYPPPDLPDKSLLPENKTEEAFWQQTIAQGWQQGLAQAMSIFTINLNLLVQSFNGMVLYKELLEQNMVSPYAVDRTEQGITGNGKHMVIDDQTLQLTTQPELLYNGSSRWQALPIAVQQPAISQSNSINQAPVSTDPSSSPATNLMNALEKAVDTNGSPSHSTPQ